MKRNPCWTPAEDALIRSGRKTIPNRTEAAIRSRRMVIVGPLNAKWTWTPAEIELIKADREVPGRTKNAIELKRLSIGLKKRENAPAWTEAEKAAIRIAPYQPISGRTPTAVRTYRVRHGLTKIAIGIRVDPREIVQRLDRMIPAGLPRYARDEVRSDMILAILEGEITARDAASRVKAFVTAYYRRHPIIGAPISLDAPMFDDGGGALIDRIPSTIMQEWL